MKSGRNKWLTLSLINLAIAALLGLVLRSKIIFEIPLLDFKNLLQAHSHFAFGGWITLCLLTLFTYELLPTDRSNKKAYKWLAISLQLCVFGMLFTFPFVGYNFLSILFSTLFIFVTYAYSWMLAKDILQTKPQRAITLLSFASLICLVLSSIGPYTLAYILATHTTNTAFYKDSIYTYLHLQYNGFFTLGIFALFINYFIKHYRAKANRSINLFAKYLALSVVPTLFLSYLWHTENTVVRMISIIGCVTLALIIVQFFAMAKSLNNATQNVNPFAKAIGSLSIIAFLLKTAVQIGIIFPPIGHAVFGDRPIIIGYIHLVMLGFVTLFFIAYMIDIRLFDNNYKTARTGIFIFTVAIILNEIVLITQGLAAMLMLGSTIYPTLLWYVAIALFSGATTIALSQLSYLRKKSN